MGNSPSRAKLIALLERERDDPRPFEQVLDEIEPLLAGESKQLARALHALAVADRQRFWVKSESIWFRRFGWRLMRPMLAACIVAAVIYAVQRAIPPSVGLMHFVFGAIAVYIMLQLYAHFWSRQDEAKLTKTQVELRDRLDRILKDLR